MIIWIQACLFLLHLDKETLINNIIFKKSDILKFIPILTILNRV